MLVLSRQKDQSNIMRTTAREMLAEFLGLDKDVSSEELFEVLMKKSPEEREELLTRVIQVDTTIVDIRGDKVRLGHNAPRCVSIHREEVQKQIDRNKEEEQ